MALTFEKNKVYSMPVFFGPDYISQQPFAGGLGRADYFPPGEIHVISLTYETDGDLLRRCIPDCYELSMPYISASVCEFTHLGHFAGNSYRLINFSCPVHFSGERDDLDGDLVLAMLENNADPIIGGRECMGYGKIYADISEIRKVGKVYSASASAWGFRFFNIEVDLEKECPDPGLLRQIEERSKGKMNYKYIPATREKEEPPELGNTRPDCAYPTILPKWEKPEDYPYEMQTPVTVLGSGTVSFRKPEWKDWPTFGNVGAGLAALPVLRVVGAKRTDYNDPLMYATAYRLR